MAIALRSRTYNVLNKAAKIQMGVAVAATALVGSAVNSRAANFGPPFDNYPYTASGERECDTGGATNAPYDQGKYQYSCKQVDLAHLNTDLFGFSKKKFGATACGRGDTQAMAQHNASVQAAFLINQLKLTQAAKAGRGASFNNDATKTQCVAVANTKGTTPTSVSTSPRPHERDTIECGSGVPGSPSETGTWQYICTQTDVAHMQVPAPQQKFKFTAKACARGETDALARLHAEERVHALIFQKKLNRATEFGEKDHNTYTFDSPDESKVSCVEGPGSGYEHDVDFSKPYHEQFWVKERTPEEQAAYEEEHRLDVERTQQRKLNEQRQREEEERRKHRVVFTIHNGDRESELGMKFYLEDKRRLVWPGDGKQYILRKYSTKEDDTFSLSCQPGEKICFGAWRDSQTTYWGVGRTNGACKSCCLTCGSTMETTLTDGGPPSYPRSSNSGSDSSSGSNSGGGGDSSLGDAIDATTEILNGLSGIAGSGSGGAPSRPVPSGRSPRSGSTLTGVPR